MPVTPLAFETDIHQLEALLERMEADPNASSAHAEEVRRLRRELTNMLKRKYAALSPWEVVMVSRHPQRPQTVDYIEAIFEDFVELHGDRAFGDDRAIRCGFARLGGTKVMVIGHQKGHTLQERQVCFYGCAHPEGYRKALGKMQLAAKFGLPVICLIDTPGAFPGIGAEERGQAQLIATSILEMSRLRTQVVCVVIGEGGSGGALGIGIGDTVSMLEFAYYSVISPEGCAGILWKTANEETKPKAAEALKLTSSDLARFGVIDDVIPEPVGGAHRDPREMTGTLKSYLMRCLRKLQRVPTDQLLSNRYDKFRRMGVHLSSRGNGEESPT